MKIDTIKAMLRSNWKTIIDINKLYTIKQFLIS